ncbi:hypothetical protein [Propionispira raffinosivorans]|uniref:hypothetical protein n=1 Tax=Propionispira raffinosivorans TaxID=86959 RepID=UPI001B7F9712|nr:hypothetical protein [Propionispira raffinosivorans]
MMCRQSRLYRGLKNDAQGLWNMFANFDETIDGIKNAAGTIYDLGKEQGFRAAARYKTVPMTLDKPKAVRLVLVKI